MLMRGLLGFQRSPAAAAFCCCCRAGCCGCVPKEGLEEGVVLKGFADGMGCESIEVGCWPNPVFGWPKPLLLPALVDWPKDALVPLDCCAPWPKIELG